MGYRVSIPVVTTLLYVMISSVLAAELANSSVGKREVITTKEQRDKLGLEWFIDGNFGVVKTGNKYQFYGANCHKPVRVTGTLKNPTQKVEHVTILSKNQNFKYLSGGPL